jgi:hypothetical protein
MNPGDLVKVVGRCASKTPSVRCETAIIVQKTGQRFKIKTGEWIKAYETACSCGSWIESESAFEVLNK